MQRASETWVGARVLAWVATIALAACFHGAERDKEAPPGNLGGLCRAPDGNCLEGMCNRDLNYCYDPVDPCNGFFCGGEERGLCMVTSELQPSCTCALGYDNDQFSLYCCPQDGSDPKCTPSGGGDETREDESSGDGDSGTG